MTKFREIDPKLYYGNEQFTSYIKDNPDKYWRLDELTDYTPEDMAALIKQETSIDLALPGSIYVMIKLWHQEEIPEEKNSKFQIDETIREANARFNTRMGKVLAFGSAAFREKKAFPTGAPCMINQYLLFNKYENQNYSIQDTATGKKWEIALIPDYKILQVITDPNIIDSSRIIDR
jgi:hypothetical protein